MPKTENSGLRPGLCTVCHHPALAEIDRALMRGESLRPLGVLYGLSPSALSRHTKHLRRALAAERDRAEQVKISGFLDELDLLRVRLDRVFHKSEDAHTLHISLGCVQELLKLLALRAKLTKSLDRDF
jgi:hypothetical protein